MPTTSITLADVITEICTQLNDPNEVRYADRASALFLRNASRMLNNPKRYRLKPLDYRGAIINEEIVIDSGEIAFGDLTNDVAEVKDVYTNSESDNDQLQYGLVEVNEKYPDYAEKADHSYFYSPEVDISFQRGWYIKDGDTIQFYPEESTDGYYVTVKYLSDIAIDDYTVSTELYSGNSGAFSYNFINIATDLTVSQLREERAR